MQREFESLVADAVEVFDETIAELLLFVSGLFVEAFKE